MRRSKAVIFIRLLKAYLKSSVNLKMCQEREGADTMPIHEVVTVKGDSRESNARQPASDIGDHRILNGGITEIGSSVWRQQRNSRLPRIDAEM